MFEKNLFATAVSGGSQGYPSKTKAGKISFAGTFNATTRAATGSFKQHGVWATAQSQASYGSRGHDPKGECAHRMASLWLRRKPAIALPP